mmetsp:Transcript_119345/g.371777  ORF Transcript_119345/g.371777 Transcript_119345/m.371777 type:complete len:283 (+) Transcript_119345:419-1267(+)
MRASCVRCWGSASLFDDTRCSRYPSMTASWPCRSRSTSSAFSGQRAGQPGDDGPANTGSSAGGSSFRSSGTYCRSSSAPPGQEDAPFKALHISETIWDLVMCKLAATWAALLFSSSIPLSKELHSRRTSSCMPCSFHRRASTSMRLLPRRRPSQSSTAQRTPLSISSWSRWSSWSISMRSFKSTVSTACSSGPALDIPGARCSAGSRSCETRAARCLSRKETTPALARSTFAETAESLAPSGGCLSSSLSRMKSATPPAKFGLPSLAAPGSVQASGSNLEGK